MADHTDPPAAACGTSRPFERHDLDELLRNLHRRHPETLAAVVQAHARDLFRAARGLGVPNDDAEDVVQDVFVTFLQTLDRFAGESQLRTWLWGILHNKVREHRRRHSREESEDDGNLEMLAARFDVRGHWSRPPADLEDLLTSEQARSAIQTCVDRLPPRLREIFRLREMEQLKMREICTLLGISDSHGGVLLHRSRLRLRECLELAGWKGSRK